MHTGDSRAVNVAPTIRRTHCAACQSASISKLMLPPKDIMMPLLPICTDAPLEDDIFAPFGICACESCGLIMLLDVVDPKHLYNNFHSDGIGETWCSHYDTFADLVNRHAICGRVVEVGAGQGKLVERLKSTMISIDVIDPQYNGPKVNKVHSVLFGKSSVVPDYRYDALISSHTLEHCIDFNEFFVAAQELLPEWGMIFTSVPNQEFGFSKGRGNSLNFEHPSVYTNVHLLAMHQTYGFAPTEVVMFKNHSVMIAATKHNANRFLVRDDGHAKSLVDEYASACLARQTAVMKLATEDKQNWLFGASNLSQPLFAYGVDESLFSGVLDNSPLKHGKRLYGTELMCNKPEDVIGKGKPVRVFLNVGEYNEEVAKQIERLDPSTERICL